MKECNCEYCPLSWEDRGVEDGDAGCYWYGNLYGTRFMCHMPNFIKKFITNARERQIDAARYKQYDGIGDWFMEEERKTKAMQQALQEKLFTNRYDEELFLCYEHNGKLYKYGDDNKVSNEQAAEIRWRYEELIKNQKEA